MAEVSAKRIRILKTGLAGVNKYLDMSVPENVRYFEKISRPGTELVLKRVYDDEVDAWRINVYSQEDVYLGKVTLAKNQTVARLMDAGLEVVAIVNESLPHNSDTEYGKTNVDDGVDTGWTSSGRSLNQHSYCNLPYGIYLVES